MTFDTALLDAPGASVVHDRAGRSTPPGPDPDDDPIVRTALRTPTPFMTRPCDPERRLDGRIALVTGADGEIGRATALLFAREGARVVLLKAPRGGPRRDGPERRLGKPGAELERTGSTIRTAGGRALVVAGDPDDSECALDGVRRAIEAWGSIDVLVLDSTDRRATGAAALVRAAAPYIGKGATFASVVREAGYAGMSTGPVHVEHASLRAARPGFAHSMRSELALEGIFADGSGDRHRCVTLTALQAGAGPANDFGHHALALRDGRACAVAACLLHLALADADWASAGD